MLSFSRTLRAVGLALLATLATFQPAYGQVKSEEVSFETVDGVKIKGDFWASPMGKKAPVALLLHEFHFHAGGARGADGWKSLANALSAKGYAVLTFDFRGHGDSTVIANPMQFWMQPHNKYVGVSVNPAKLPESLGNGTFLPAYYRYLVNDVAAAKAFLDRKNDAGELNTSNMVVIGAGEGATIGALWLATEFHKKRGIPKVMAVGPPIVDPRLINFDPNYEGKDVRCAIWLGISDTLGKQNVPVKQWVIEGSGSKTNKVPVYFVFGKDDKAADNISLAYLRAINPSYDRVKVAKDDPLPLSGEKGIEKTKLAASGLLLKSLGTESFIVDSYLGSEEMKKNLKEGEWRERDSTKSRHYWLFQTNPMLPPIVVPAKNENDLAPQLLPLNRFGLPN